MTRTSKSERLPNLSGKSIREIFRMLDPYTRNHSRRISRMSVIIARKMGIKDKDELRSIRLGSLYHDIGKIFIPVKILNKPDPLSKSEYASIRKHAEHGTRIIQKIPDLSGVVEIIHQHHECWDGSGYPQGLKGEKICLGARICCLVDSFDAMRTDRPYSIRKPLNEVLIEIRRCMGHRFDPGILETFNKCFSQLDKIACGR